MLLWMGNLDLKMCDVLNDDPNYFFRKWHNRNQCKKTGLIFRKWSDDVVLNFLIG